MTHSSVGTLRAALVGAAAAVVLVLGGCSSDSADPGAAATTTSSLVAPRGFEAATLVVTLSDGSTREWCVWLADTTATRRQGLMGVTDPELGGLDAMAFSFPADTASGFWMKDTLLPLSIAWYAADGSLVSSTDMEPCPADVESCPSSTPDGPYRIAIEVPQGGLEALGLVDGSTVALGGACTRADAST